MNRTEAMVTEAERYTAHNYHPLPVVIAEAEGAWVTDVDGRRYLDCLAGYSALNFGHRHPALLEAARAQLERVTLTSRAFLHDQFGPFCRELAGLCRKDLVLPMNTGAEAVETAIKVARKWGYRVKGVPAERASIVVAADNFHGRTVTIVSNNSVEAILAYLDAHDTPAHIRTIYGREDADPAHMKPHPYQIHRAVSGLPYGVSPGQCALIGESTSDVTAGHLARAVVIGYASEPSKIDLLRAAEADAITADLAEITIALHNTPIAE